MVLESFLYICTIHAIFASSKSCHFSNSKCFIKSYLVGQPYVIVELFFVFMGNLKFSFKISHF